MRHIVPALIVILLLLFTAAIGQQYAPTDSIDQKIAAVSYHVPFEVPGGFGRLFGDERLVITVYGDDYLLNVSAVTEKRQLVSFEKGTIEDHTVRVHITEKTIKDIWAADNPLKEATDALNSGKIDYEAVTFTKTMKLKAVGLFSRVLSWFL